MKHMIHLLVTASTLAMIPLLGGCQDSPDCSTLACRNGATLTAQYVSSPARLNGGRLLVCRNKTCSYATVQSDGFSVSIGSYFMQELAMDYLTFDGDKVIVTLEGPRGTQRDGDLYTLELRDSTGMVVASGRWQAQYETIDPNGEECDDGCLYAELH